MCHPTRRRTLLALAAACTAGGLTRSLSAAAGDGPSKDDEDRYGLDSLSRRIPPRGPIACPDVELTTYRGRHLRYAEPARVYVGFVERLERFEAIANQVAERIYGRAPRRLRHLGTYNCRRISAYPQWVSEHGLGNAIDVEGFDFGPLPKGQSAPEGLPKAFAGPFAVRVVSHWKSRHPLLAPHARFLRALARATLEEKQLFRVLLGPGYPGHHNHFHFDCAPYRLMDGFDT